MSRKRDIKLVDEVARRLKLSKEQRRLLHLVVTGQGFGFREIEEIGRDIKQDYPNK